MAHKLYRVVTFGIVGDYKLSISFDDGVTTTVNFESILIGPQYGPLQELSLFNQVAIDPIAATLTWPNGADFDPETLRHWGKYKELLRERLKMVQPELL